MNTPGRTCPRTYRTRPEALREQSPLTAETVYIIGGLYGNEAALAAVEALAEREVEVGRPRPVLFFNGDFNWFNATPDAFRRVNETVLAHTALQGNVEAEVATPSPGAGCGCAYPDWVGADTVARSNRIMERLQEVGTAAPTLVDRLGALPCQRAVQVGEATIGVVHGDPESLAGWGLAVEAMPPPGRTPDRIADWFRAAAVDAFACTHTCLPYLQAFEVERQRRLAVNNGAAGMPNFRGDDQGLLTRIGTTAFPGEALYGTRLRGTYVDAVGVPCRPPAWLEWFDDTWPPGSPARESYRGRIVNGPNHHRADAVRLRQGAPPRSGPSGSRKPGVDKTGDDRTGCQ